jgi:hypothetical protein
MKCDFLAVAVVCFSLSTAFAGEGGLSVQDMQDIQESRQANVRALTFQMNVRDFLVTAATPEQQKTLKSLNDKYDPKIKAAQDTLDSLTAKKKAAVDDVEKHLPKNQNGPGGLGGKSIAQIRLDPVNKKYDPQIKKAQSAVDDLENAKTDEIDKIVGKGLKPLQYKDYEKFMHMTKADRIEFGMNMPEN